MRPSLRSTLLLCGALVLTLSCKTAPEAREALAEPTMPQQDLQIVTQSLTDVAVKFSATVEGTSENVTLDSLTYEFVVDEKVIKSGQKTLGLALSANGKVDFQVEEAFAYVKDEAELKAMDARGGSMLLALRGKVKATAKLPAQGDQPASTQTFELEFARSKDVRTPRLPHLKLTEWEGGRFSETEVQIVYHLGVVNPNPFPVSVQGVEYAVTLAGKEVSKGTIGAGEKVSPASTGVFDVSAVVNEETHGAEAKKLIKGLVLPYELTGTLKTALYQEPLTNKGQVKLNPPK